MSLSTALLRLYPGSDSIVDWSVENRLDGKGERISHWDTAKLGAQPTERAISTASDEAEAEFIRTQYQRDRESAYNARGAKIKDMVVALWEKQVEGRTDAADASELIRQDVKLENPQ